MGGKNASIQKGSILQLAGQFSRQYVTKWRLVAEWIESESVLYNYVNNFIVSILTFFFRIQSAGVDECLWLETKIYVGEQIFVGGVGHAA